MLWGLFNIIAGYLLFICAPIGRDQPALVSLFFAGIALMGIQGSLHFPKRDKE